MNLDEVYTELDHIIQYAERLSQIYADIWKNEASAYADGISDAYDDMANHLKALWLRIKKTNMNPAETKNGNNCWVPIDILKERIK